jgi:hypothetical protein
MPNYYVTITYYVEAESEEDAERIVVENGSCTDGILEYGSVTVEEDCDD